MKCLMDKSREVSYPCSRACPMFGDCVVEFETERSAGGMGGPGSSSPAGLGFSSPAGHGHSVEGIVVLERQEYSSITNGDRLRAMSDEELADWLTYFDRCEHCAYEGHCTSKCIGGIKNWLKQPAEEGK